MANKKQLTFRVDFIWKTENLEVVTYNRYPLHGQLDISIEILSSVITC